MDVFGKAKDWWNARRERIAEQKRVKLHHDRPSNAAPLVWCLFITFVGVFTLVGSTWLFTVFIAGSVGHLDWFSDYQSTQAGVSRWEWNFEAAIHWFPAIGLWSMCLGIGIFNACWIELRKHFHGAFRNWITGLGLATALFMVAGGVAMQQRGTDARERDTAAAVGAAQAGVAAIDADIAALERRWQTLCAPNLTTWQAQACRSGEQAWNDRIVIARGQYRENDPQMQIIARAIADAREGDRMQTRLAELRRQRAAASVQTVQAETATVRATGVMASAASVLEEARKPIASILGELLAMSAFSMALAAWASRRPYKVPQDRSGWAEEGLQIEDKRDEPAGEVQPMTPPRKRRKVYNPETGREEVFVQPKGHWRPVGKKVRNADGTVGELMEVIPEAQPDETGVEYDGGGRVGSAAADPDASVETEHASKPEDGNANEQVVAGDAQPDTHPEPSYEPQETLSDEEAVKLAEEYALAAAEDAAANGDASAHAAEPEGDVADDDAGQAHDTPPTDRQPETREDRLLAAE